MKVLLTAICVIMLATTAHATTWQVTSDGEGGGWVNTSSGALVNR